MSHEIRTPDKYSLSFLSYLEFPHFAITNILVFRFAKCGNSSFTGMLQAKKSSNNSMASTGILIYL